MRRWFRVVHRAADGEETVATDEAGPLRMAIYEQAEAAALGLIALGVNPGRLFIREEGPDGRPRAERRFGE